MRRWLFLMLAFLIVPPVAAQQPLPPPHAALRSTFFVDSTLDAVDNNIGDGNCVTLGGVCTLRAAVQEANAVGSGQIYLSSATYTTTLIGDEDNAASGDFDVTGYIGISGPDFGLATVANGIDERLFDVRPGGGLFLDHLAVTGGSDDNGGCISLSGATLTLDNARLTGCGATESGGALFFNYRSWVEIRDSQFNFNAAQFGGAISTYSGAGGGGSSTILVERSLFKQNTALYFGGAIYSQEADFALVNSTVTGNSSTAPLDNYGGGLAFGVMPSMRVLIEHSTIAGNTAAIGGGFAVDGALPTVRNSIVAGNTSTEFNGHDCTFVNASTFAYTSQGVNFIGDPGGCVDANPTGVTLSGSAGLLPLADYGGANGLMSHVPDADSPVLDAADPAYCPSIDQRAVSRPQYGMCDLGADERVTFNLMTNGGFEPESPGGACSSKGWKIAQPGDKAVKDSPNSGECALRYKARHGKTGSAKKSLMIPAYVQDDTPDGEAIFFRVRVKTDLSTAGSIKVRVVFTDGTSDSGDFTLGDNENLYEVASFKPIRLELARAGVMVKKVQITVTSTGTKGKWYMDDAEATWSRDGI